MAGNKTAKEEYANRKYLGNQHYGIRFAWGRGNLIHGMNIQFNGGKGISFDDTQSDDGYGNRIEGCYFEANGNADNPFFYIGSRNNTIIGNTIIKHTGSNAQIFKWNPTTINGGPSNDWKSGNYIIGNTILDNTDMINGPFVRKDVFLSKVGIGTASPIRQLTINHPNDPTLGLYTDDFERVTLRADGAYNFKIDTKDTTRVTVDVTGRVGIGIITPGSKLTIKGTGNTSATSSLNVTDKDNNSKLFVRDDGKVGIGIQTPSTALDVNGVQTLRPVTTTPDDPSISSEGRIYVKGGKLIVQYKDGATVRYKYLPLGGTNTLWVHTTTKP